MKNPNWTEEELILALDLYHRVPSAIGDPNHPAVRELSDLLNSFDIHPRAQADQKFRNPNGVATKLANFRSHDPSTPSRGLSHGSKLEEVVWNKYAKELSSLRTAAKRIKESHGAYSHTKNETQSELRQKLSQIRTLLNEIESMID